MNVIYEAITAFSAETGLDLAIKNTKVAGVDAEQITLTYGDNISDISAIIGISLSNAKHAVAEASIRKLIYPHEGIVFAKHINPAIAKALKTENIQFIDTVGNAYFKSEHIYVFNFGNKPKDTVTHRKESQGKAFTPKGMQVVLALLLDSELVKKSFRSISEVTGVALGTVKLVMDDLVNLNYVHMVAKQRKLLNKNELVEGFLKNYSMKFRNKQALELFTTTDIERLDTIDISQYEALWGGEYAAEVYTNYLKASSRTIYLPEQYKSAFIKQARLRKPKANENIDYAVNIITPYTKTEYLEGNKELVHPFLVYAELITSGEPRQMETAEKLNVQIT